MPEGQELCSPVGPSADGEPWEDFLQGRGVRPLTSAAASGTETQARGCCRDAREINQDTQGHTADLGPRRD